MPINGVSIDTIVLGSHAETNAQSVTLIAGGSTRIRRNLNQQGEPVSNHFGIMVVFRCHGEESQRDFGARLQIAKQGETSTLLDMQLQFQATRDTWLPKGSDWTSPIGFSIDAIFPTTGTYRVWLQLDGGNEKSMIFVVHDEEVPPPARA